MSALLTTGTFHLSRNTQTKGVALRLGLSDLEPVELACVLPPAQHKRFDKTQAPRQRQTLNTTAQRKRQLNTTAQRKRSTQQLNANASSTQTLRLDTNAPPA